MEVTRQLRRERVDKKGLAPIQLTFCWDGQRLRLPAGQKCLPKDWDEKRGRTKAKPGTYLDDVNQVLNRYQDAATAAHAATLAGRPLDKDAMRAEIEQRYQRLTQEASGEVPAEILAPPAPTEPTFLDYFQRWIDAEATKVSVRTGRVLSRDVIYSHNQLKNELVRFQEAADYQVRLTGISPEFYELFRNYSLGAAGRSPRTFNGYLKQLRQFLFWCEEQEVPVSPRFRRVLRLVPGYVGVEALTEAELRHVASLDLRTPAVLSLVTARFPLTYEQRSLAPAEHLERLNWVRDKFLLCAYTGLRLSDADRLAPEHVQGDLLRMRAGKTDVICRVPLVDDDVFQPQALLARYAPLGLATYLPWVRDPWKYLPLVQELSGITRLHLGMHVGRKTFATLKIYQGVPRSQVMMATGHQTEANFNRYLGIDEKELMESYRRTARKVVAETGGKSVANVA
jgi:integrase